VETLLLVVAASALALPVAGLLLLLLLRQLSHLQVIPASCLRHSFSPATAHSN
jgi:hypothetical protein